MGWDWFERWQPAVRMRRGADKIVDLPSPATGIRAGRSAQVAIKGAASSTAEEALGTINVRGRNALIVLSAVYDPTDRVFWSVHPRKHDAGFCLRPRHLLWVLSDCQEGRRMASGSGRNKRAALSTRAAWRGFLQNFPLPCVNLGCFSFE
jgi:hypothetical protein